MPVPDRPGVLAEVTTLLGELTSTSRTWRSPTRSRAQGVLVMVVRQEAADGVRAALADRGFRPWSRVLE